MKRLMLKLSELMEIGGIRKDIALILISGAGIVLSLFGIRPFGADPAWIAIILCGIPIILEAMIGLITEFDITADVLVAMALIASVYIGEIFAAGEVAFIMQLGGLLEELTVAKARDGIERLVSLTPTSARRVKDKVEELISAEEVRPGDILRVLPGEVIPVDGVITSGQTSIDQAVMTGESMPVDKWVGDEVSSGTLNQYGAFEMRAEKVGEDSSIQRMIRLVRSADAGKAKIVGIADKWAVWVVIIAVLASVITYIFTHEIIRSVTILVVFCPCALVLATPTAIMAAIGNATKHGFLVREGDALERLASVNKISFDKTGTLTYGKPVVAEVKSYCRNLVSEELYKLVASAETNSEHPLGKAIVRSFKETYGEEIVRIKSFEMMAGKGIKAVVRGKEILAGNEKLLLERGCEIPEKMRNDVEDYMKRGCTITYAAVDGVTAGFLALRDVVRAESAAVVAELRKIGVEAVLLTGDNEKTAEAIADETGIEKVYSKCLPEDKLEHIREYQAGGEMVCMVGDGVNDAPALKCACTGIAMGGIGSDIAVDAADIALVDDEIKELPHLIALSKRMMTVIKRNLIFSMTINFIAIILAITGILNPVVGALVHNAGSVFVIINSALLLGWRGLYLF